MEDKESWLRQRYIGDLAPKSEIANELGCSIHNVDRLLRKYDIKRGRVYQKTKRPWNFGLTKETDERVAVISENHKGERNPMFGKDAWNKGLTVDDERVKRMVMAALAAPFTEERREKMRSAKLGKRGREANNYKRGYTVNVQGYVEVHDGRNRRYLHRKIAEDFIGRALLRSEHVHHIDGDTMNNNPHNLLILKNSTHTQLHKLSYPGTKSEQIKWLTDNDYWFVEIGVKP